MAYSDFTIAELKQRFGLAIDEADDLFAHVAEADMPASLTDTLARYLPLALNLSTEKARSELVIAPVLVEFKLLHRDRISLFSGVEFSVDEASGLKGRCDYILARSPEQLALTAPVCVLVEAKNENIVAGIPQCLALKPVIDALEGRGLSQEKAAPLRACDVVQRDAGFVLPALICGPAVSDGVVDVPVRLSHLLKARMVDNEIGAKHVEQRVKIVAA